MSINAGVKLLPATGSEAFVSPSWTNIQIEVNYPTGQNRTNNYPTTGDIIVDQLGQIWLINSAISIAGTNKFTCKLTYVELSTPTSDIVPDLGSTSKGAIMTPSGGKLAPFWDATYVSDPVFRKARTFSVTNNEAVVGGTLPSNGDTLYEINTRIDNVLGSSTLSNTRDSLYDLGTVIDTLQNSNTTLSSAVSDITAGVTTDGNTLKKLNDKIVALLDGAPTTANTLYKLYSLIQAGGTSTSTSGLSVYTVKVLNWSSGTYSIPSGWTVQKEYSNTALRVTHNLNKSPVGWSGINLESSPNVFITPSSTRNVQIIDTNTCILTQCAVGNIFSLTLFFI